MLIARWLIPFILLSCLNQTAFGEEESLLQLDPEELQNPQRLAEEAKRLQAKPFDFGLGLGVGGPITAGLDFTIGRRLRNTDNWQFGVQYHFMGGALNTVYATATKKDWPLELKLGPSVVTRYDATGNATLDPGLALGAGLFTSKHLFADELRMHLLDIHYVVTPRDSYTTVSISLFYLLQALSHTERR